MKKWTVALALLLTSLCTFAQNTVSIDDPIFSDATAKEGLRSFDTFPAAGLYQLEEFTPEKPVVVMLHGANGHPGNFKELAASAQAKGAQVWLPYYPSGVSLDSAAYYVSGKILMQAKSHGVDNVTVIAHSMGGLVAIKAVAILARMGVTVKQLTTVASPLGGHPAALLGTWFSAQPQPNWYDLAPGSHYLNDIQRDETLANHVIVAVARDTALDSDGVIPLFSQLQTDMVQKAKAVYQLSESHLGVLFNAKTVRAIIDISV